MHRFHFPKIGPSIFGPSFKVTASLEVIYAARNSFIFYRTLNLGGFPNEIKTKIRYLIICCYHNFIL